MEPSRLHWPRAEDGGVNPRIAIIGGSGLQTLPDFRILEQISVTTPWGALSTPVQVGTLDGVEDRKSTRLNSSH